MATTAELRQLLKEDASGKNLYDHLTETLMKILVERPKNAYDSFELISAEVKANPLNPDPQAGRVLPPAPEELAKQLDWTKECSALLKVPEEAPEDSGVAYPSLAKISLMELAGLSFGKGDTYRLYLSVKKLAETLPAEVERLRFFGRITTRSMPYYILQGSNPEEEEADEKLQEGKTGANKYAFWVTQNFESGKWIKLPNVTSDQIVKARLFKRLFTGDLSAKVPSYPPFPGTEANLLRAQIARILGATSISPEGFFELEEDDETGALKRIPVAELAPKPASELKEPDSWKHHEIDLNIIGRVTLLPVNEDDEEAAAEEPAEVNPPLDSVKPEAWAFRMVPGGAGASDNCAVIGRSLVWPGAVAVSMGLLFANVYFGNGVIYESKPYSPPLPGPIQKEWTPVEDDPLGPLEEQPDVRADPTPPVPEGEEEED